MKIQKIITIFLFSIFCLLLFSKISFAPLSEDVNSDELISQVETLRRQKQYEDTSSLEPIITTPPREEAPIPEEKKNIPMKPKSGIWLWLIILGGVIFIIMFRKRDKASRERAGFTLVEFMMAMGILVVGLVVLLGAYVGSFDLIEFSKSLTLALNSAQAQMEPIKNANFTQVDSFSGAFSPAGFSFGNARGRIEISNVGDLKRVRIVICWKEKSGRIIGEDNNLNGQLDVGEDTNANNRLDSPCEAVSLVGNIKEE